MQNYSLKHLNNLKDSKQNRNTQICLKTNFWADLSTNTIFDENNFKLDSRHLKTQTKHVSN